MREGEQVTIFFEQRETGKEKILTGIVDKKGFARIENAQFEKNEIIQISEEPEKLPEPVNTEKKNEVYKTYEGKDYTEAEWVKKEQELWEKYQAKKNRRGFFGFLK
jgi:hypothetical protein